MKKITEKIIKKLPKSLPAVESSVQETGQILDCGFYLPVSMSRNDLVPNHKQAPAPINLKLNSSYFNSRLELEVQVIMVHFNFSLLFLTFSHISGCNCVFSNSKLEG